MIDRTTKINVYYIWFNIRKKKCKKIIKIFFFQNTPKMLPMRR